MDITTRIMHLGIMIFALSAYLTGDMADDYKKVEYLGFTIHKWLGMGVAFFILSRIIYGFVGPKKARFSKWVPTTKERFKEAGEALISALSYKRPSAPPWSSVVRRWSTRPTRTRSPNRSAPSECPPGSAAWRAMCGRSRLPIAP